MNVIRAALALALVLSVSSAGAQKPPQPSQPPQGWQGPGQPPQQAQPPQPTPPQQAQPAPGAKPPGGAPPGQAQQPGQPQPPAQQGQGSQPAPPAAPPALAEGGSEQVRTVQILLRLAGVEPGNADGLLSDSTREAIRLFERSQGLPVTGQVSEGLVARLNQTALLRSPGTRPLRVAQTGTGFAITRQGHLVTNHHVINGCQQLRVRPGTGGDPQTVQLVTQDQPADLAVLRMPGPVETVATFRDGRSIRVGDAVVVIGFPLRGLLAAEAAVTAGEVSALAGLRNDARHMTVSAPVQPGNSGGPVFDRSGNLVGVVVSKLNAQQVAQVTGDIPQNVNFAIKASVLRNLLEAAGVEYELAASTQTLEPADIADRARRFTYVVECMR